MSGPRFTARDHAVFRILSDAAEARLPTPRHVDLAKVLEAAGHVATKDVVANSILKLRRGNLLDVLGSGDSTGSRRYYVILATGAQTVPRGADTAVPGSAERKPDAPILTLWRGDGANYDAAVAAKAFGMHEVRPRFREALVHRVQKAPQSRSYTGCTAAMVAT